MRKNITLFILLILCTATAFSQEDKSVLKKAYHYRTDIDEQVLKQTKQWPEKVGILHSDWIENRNGKSIDLLGNILFPQYEYTQLEKQCGYWIMTVNGKKGLLNSNGDLLANFEYLDFKFTNISSGIVTGVKNRSTNDRIDVGYFFSYDNLCSIDEYEFVNNAWVDRFAYYYNMKDYQKAEFCLNYYSTYEKEALRCAYGLHYFQALRYEVLLYMKKGMYGDVISYFQSANIPAIKYDKTNDILILASNFYFPDIQKEEIDNEIQYLNINYQNCKTSYEKQLIVQAKQQERAALMAAFIVGTAAAVTGAVISDQEAQRQREAEREAQKREAQARAAAEAAGIDYDRARAEAAIIEAGGVIPSSSSTSSSSSEGELVTVAYEEKCTTCNGTGECNACKGTGESARLGNNHTCNSCKGSGKCYMCNGKGTVTRHKNVREK